MIIEKSFSADELNTPTATASMEEAVRLKNELSNLHLGISMGTLSLYWTVPPYNYQDVIESVRADYDLFQQKKTDLLDTIYSALQQLGTGISRNALTDELLKLARDVIAYAKDENTKLMAYGKAVRERALAQFDLIKKEGDDRATYVRKAGSTVSATLDTTKALEISKEIMGTAKEQAKANPLLVVGLVLSAIKLFGR